jgi:hypothetical protein
MLPDWLHTPGFKQYTSDSQVFGTAGAYQHTQICVVLSLSPSTLYFSLRKRKTDSAVDTPEILADWEDCGLRPA